MCINVYIFVNIPVCLSFPCDSYDELFVYMHRLLLLLKLDSD